MSTSSTETTSSNSQPWSVQQPYLKSAWEQAQNLYGKTDQNRYEGDQLAQMTTEQLDNFRNMIGFGNNLSGPNAAMGIGQDTAGAGYSALQNSLSGLANYKPQGGVDSNIAAATAYANNPAVDGMVQGAMRDATRQVSEQALPQIARQSAATGNTLGSRSALSQGLVQRGLADATADTSASIRGNLFNQGLQLAEQGRQFDNSSYLQSLGAAASQGNSAITGGIGGMGAGINMAGNMFGMAGAGGAGLQQNNQLGIDNSKGMMEYANGTQWQNLQNLWSIVGSNNWGGQQNGTKTSTPSMWSTIGSGLGMLGSIFSDRRVKKDIRCIGQADNGLPIYTFRYLDDPSDTVCMGFIAQDVEKVRPEAVTQVNGILAVNYELASR